jgi:hypothetical protein
MGGPGCSQPGCRRQRRSSRSMGVIGSAPAAFWQPLVARATPFASKRGYPIPTTSCTRVVTLSRPYRARAIPVEPIFPGLRRTFALGYRISPLQGSRLGANRLHDRRDACRPDESLASGARGRRVGQGRLCDRGPAKDVVDLAKRWCACGRVAALSHPTFTAPISPDDFPVVPLAEISYHS